MEEITKALELSHQYGITAVVLFVVVFFLAYLIIYVLKENRAREKEQSLLNVAREERLAKLIEVHINAIESKTNERHIENQKAMATLAEADRRQREEHEVMIRLQRDSEDQHKKIALILERIMTRFGIKENSIA